MDTTVALTIIGMAMALVGVIFIAIPKAVNKKTIQHMPEGAEGLAALFRSANGALGLAIGCVALFCRNFPQESAQTLLLAIGVGLILAAVVLSTAKWRGFEKTLPIPPLVLFTVLAAIAFYASLP